MTEERRTTSEEAKRVGDMIGVDWSRFDLPRSRAVLRRAVHARDSSHAPNRSRSAVSGRRPRHNAARSALGRHSESSQPPPPESARLSDAATRQSVTLSSQLPELE
jgi:hypothetical protein